MKKILIVSTVSRQFYLFEQGNIEVLKSLGYEVHGAANFEDANERLEALDIVRHPFDIQRSPFSLKNIKAYKQLKKIMKSENFDAVHCHSPMGGVLARLAARSLGLSLVIYTAHGFHFFKGAPILNWLVYYPVEKWLARYTDTLITINKEDYEQAKNNFKAKRVKYIPGVGLDIDKFKNVVVDVAVKREEIGVPQNAFVVLSIGELNKNKNHEVVLRAIAKLNNSNIHYVICGRGPLEFYLKKLSNELGVSVNVHLLGFRKDILEICKISNIFAFPSLREGLPVSLMEAMASGLPVVCSEIRGNQDLIENGKGGYLINPRDIDGFANVINNLANEQELRKTMMSLSNLEAIKKFDVKNVKKEMKKIYKDIVGGVI